MNEQDIERQIDLMENSENWSIYRDHEKRAIAFRAGVEFANTIASGVDLSGRWVNDPLELPTEAQKLFWNECSQKERKAIVEMAKLGTLLPPQPVEPVAGQVVADALAAIRKAWDKVRICRNMMDIRPMVNIDHDFQEAVSALSTNDHSVNMDVEKAKAVIQEWAGKQGYTASFTSTSLDVRANTSVTRETEEFRSEVNQTTSEASRRLKLMADELREFGGDFQEDSEDSGTCEAWAFALDEIATALQHAQPKAVSAEVPTVDEMALSIQNNVLFALKPPIRDVAAREAAKAIHALLTSRQEGR